MRIQGCCTFPHGQCSIYVFIMSISAYLFAISASWGCYYVNVDATFSAKEGSDGALFTDYSAGFGLFSYEDGADQSEGNFDWVCYAYNDKQMDNLDSTFTTAKMFAVVSNILIGASMVFLVMACCIEFTRIFLKLLGTAMIVGGCCQLATFMVFGSQLCADYGCTFYVGAGLAICTFLVATIAGIITCFMPESVEPFKSEELGLAREPFQPGTITETETIMPDGTTKITKTTVNLDGSKTIEEDIYDPPDEDGYQDEPGRRGGYDDEQFE